MMRRDVQATDAKAYKDNRSHITLDGREILYGLDWQQRKKELWIRCKGQCEHMGRYLDIGTDKFVMLRCPVKADDPHHIIPRSKGRNDAIGNLLALCRWHHSNLDKRKPMWSKREHVESLVKR